MRIIPPEEWGEDHLTTLLYVETRCVDNRGIPKNEHMRCNPARHPAQAHSGTPRHGGKFEGSRLLYGASEPDHDDWDCVDDMEAAGLLTNDGTGVNPLYRLTDAGWKEAHRLRRERAERSNSFPRKVESL